jgi:hypothetical protein
MVPVMKKKHVYSLTIFYHAKVIFLSVNMIKWISNQEILMSFLQKMEARTHLLLLSNFSAAKAV